MVFLFALSALLTGVCLLILAPSLFNKRQLSAVDLQKENVSIAKQRLAEISPDNQSSEEARLELEAALIDDLKGTDYAIHNDKPAGRGAAIVILLLIPVASALLYLQLGNHDWNKQAALPTVEDIEQDPSRSIEILITRLEQVLEEQPDDPAGWHLAARTYMGTQQFAKAERAYSKVHELSGDHPDTLTAWADASLMVNNNHYTEEIASRISRALELDSNHVSALWLAAMGAQTNGSIDIALGYLQRLLPLVENNPEATRETKEAITRMGGEIQAAEATVQSKIPDGRQVSVNLSLSSEVASKASADDTVFVFATEKDGPPAPLAVVRVQVKELPLTILLDHTRAMLPGRTIDIPAVIEIGARVALSGEPTRSPGDLESAKVEISDRGASDIDLSIDMEIE